MKRLILSLALLLVAAPACNPYGGPSQKLKRPKKKKRPGGTSAATTMPLDEKCKTNFFKPPKTSRSGKNGRRLAAKADRLLVKADDADGAEKVSLVADAMTTLRNALKSDPYGPEPTYKLAVAYAMVGKKGCSVKLLERLSALQKHPEASLASEAGRTVKRALGDESFAPFRKDADAALGE